jgi:hypothetical protein
MRVIAKEFPQGLKDTTDADGRPVLKRAEAADVGRLLETLTVHEGSPDGNAPIVESQKCGVKWRNLASSLTMIIKTNF